MPTRRRSQRPAGSRLRSLGARAMGRARDAGLLPYRPERWTDDQWREAYGSDQLDYFGDIEELARYSIIGGYTAFLDGHPRVLDVGCGTGRLLDHLRGVAYARYLGIDIAPTAIASAMARVDERASFHVGDVDSVGAESFDVVVLNEVLYFAPEPDALLHRVDALLEPGGTLLTSMWRHPGDLALWRRIERRFELVDRVDVRNPANTLAVAGWRIACHRKPLNATT